MASAVLALGLLSPLAAAPATASPSSAAGTGVAVQGTGVDHGWWYDAMGIAAAHKRSTGSGVTVAVLDTAVDTGAPTLRGADVHPRTTCAGEPARSADPTDSSTPFDAHGTSMASFVAGVAPAARILTYDIGVEGTPARRACTRADIVRLMLQAAKDGADIISFSNAGDGRLTYEPEIPRVLRTGAVLVAATGNTDDVSVSGEHTIEFPAGLPGVVAVNAVDSRARPWSLNPRADDAGPFRSFPTISAPGVNVVSPDWARGRGWFTAPASGTSPATAIVAGSLALVKSRYPDATGNQLIQQLVHHPGGTRGYAYDTRYGYGIDSVTNMLRTDPTGWPDQNPLAKRPGNALRAYPMSSYGRSAGTASAGATASPGAASSSAAPAGDPASTSASSASDGSGAPGWLWPVGGVLVLAVVAGGLVVARRSGRRGGRRPATDGHAKEGVRS